MKHLSKLASIGSAEIGKPGCGVSSHPRELESIFDLKNGFYAFESALLVRHRGGGSSSTAINVYYMRKFVFGADTVGKAAGTRVGGFAYVRDTAVNRLETAAHEIGHIFGLKHSDERYYNDVPVILNPGFLTNDNHKSQLMYRQELPHRPRLLIHGEWDIVNNPH